MHLRVILVLVAALLVGTWMSPCCCQTTWVADAGATLLHAGTEGEGCCSHCSHGAAPKHRCPLEQKDCKQSGGKLATGEATLKIHFSDAGGWMLTSLVEMVSIAPPASACVEHAEHEPPGVNGVGVSLVQLRCALTI